MGKFETRGQIVSLFVGAACVGVLLIVLLTAEANKRQDALNRSDKIIISEAGDMSELTGIRYFWSQMKNSIRSLTKSDKDAETGRKLRRKREVSPDYYSNHIIEGEYDDILESIDTEDTTEHKNLLTEKPFVDKKSLPSVTANLGSALLSSALTGHKIRHIEEKLSMLGQDSQLVKAVLDMFCTKEETVLYVMCMSTANTTEQENTTEADTVHDDKKNETEVLGTNKTAEHTKNYADDLSNYVNVMRNRLAPQSSNSVIAGDSCSSFTEFIIVVILTSFANFFGFVLISLFCRIPKKIDDTSLTESNEHLVAVDDNLDSDPVVQGGLKNESGTLHVNFCHQIGRNEGVNKI
eukprot:GFUD01007110.1.p1 GENE.GFUD01007110.1~~GFUD01007110.1.p1  ORF type:complete len:351 (+),score=105.56 GFUD01007110.1:196-1248(+)